LLVDTLFELLVVVFVLADPVDCSLLVSDGLGILTDDVAELRNLLSHHFLVDAKVINFEASLSICVVVVPQL